MREGHHLERELLLGVHLVHEAAGDGDLSSARQAEVVRGEGVHLVGGVGMEGEEEEEEEEGEGGGEVGGKRR